MTVTIRPARPEDAQALPAIERDAGRSFLAIPDLAWIASGSVMSVDEHLPRIVEGTAWVAEEAEAGVIGFLSAEAVGVDLHIWEAAVRSAFQQHGIGARLFGAAFDHARAAGLTAVTLTTFRDVAWNAPFYARNGFAIVEAGDLDERLAGLLRQEADWGMPRRCAMRRRVS
jgi:GNAT superfamily N-acetyltransferase